MDVSLFGLSLWDFPKQKLFLFLLVLQVFADATLVFPLLVSQTFAAQHEKKTKAVIKK